MVPLCADQALLEPYERSLSCTARTAPFFRKTLKYPVDFHSLENEGLSRSGLRSDLTPRRCGEVKRGRRPADPEGPHGVPRGILVVLQGGAQAVLR